jgi:hypothetical protein
MSTHASWRPLILSALGDILVSLPYSDSGIMQDLFGKVKKKRIGEARRYFWFLYLIPISGILQNLVKKKFGEAGLILSALGDIFGFFAVSRFRNSGR